MESKLANDVNILVIDDEVELGNMIVMTLKTKGYEAEFCSDPLLALQKIQSFKYQLVITDIRMPKLDGLEVLKQVKKISQFIEVVMVTGFSSLELALECLEMGALDFLFKPFEDIQEIYDTVEAAIRKIHKWRKILAKAGKINKLDPHNILNPSK